MKGAAAIMQLLDDAPAFADAPAPSAETIRRFGLSELDTVLARVLEAEGDAREAELDAAAAAVGGLVAAGALHDAFARAALEDAAAKCGLVRDITLKRVKAAIAAGIKTGAKRPLDLSGIPDEDMRRPAAPKKSRPRPAAVIESSPSAAGAAAPAQQPSSSSFSSSAPPVPPHLEKSSDETLATAEDGEQDSDDGDDQPPDETISEDTFRYCAGLDQSDVDNGKRLIAYFGRDLLVRQEDDVPAGQMMAWTGTHWDLAGGEALAHLIGQRVGDLIKQEAGYIDLTPSEARTVQAGEAAAAELKDLNPDGDTTDNVLARIKELNEIIATAKRARAALSSRRTTRRKWGVSTKNAGRIAAMIKCAAPHLRRHPDSFNADQLKVATLTHTLSFVPIIDRENPDPDGTRHLVDRETGRVQYRLKARRGHDRKDMLTAVIPFAYDKQAVAPDFDAFLDLFQPEPKKRRTVQQYSGMSLTAQPVQRIMYHTGTGGNGKSVYLEVLARVLGDGLAVGVPAESVSGQVQNNPSAPTPDIARCYAKRYIRIAELPKDSPLKGETIKKLTGGERWPVRTMYKGYFEFKPTAKPHMSGNGEPKFDGADGGLKRRLLFVEWSVKLAEEKHRDFEDVVSKIVSGGSGILNWLIAGALDFLNNGFVIAEDVQARTDDTFADRDPCAQFVGAHVREDAGGPGVTGRAMYEAYELWCKANGTSKMFETKFGLIMKTKLKRDDSGRVRRYVDVALHDVPESSSHPPAQGAPPGPFDHEF